MSKSIPTKRLGKRRKLTAANIQAVNAEHGVYLIRDEKGKPLYIGHT